MINVETNAAAGADKLMHAALHLVGKHVPDDDFSYSDLAVWQSNDTAVHMLIMRYSFLYSLLQYAYKVNSL